MFSEHLRRSYGLKSRDRYQPMLFCINIVNIDNQY